jgi:uncharacterized membrane protein HdeD (DUF308 family)
MLYSHINGRIREEMAVWTILSRNWWVFLLRGILAVIFGILALIWPGTTLLTLIILFGAYALVDGIFAIIAGVAGYGTTERWWAEVIEGVLGMVIGLMTLLWPGATALVVLYFIAAWAIVTGILEIAAAIQMRRYISGEWLLFLSGAVSVLFGVLLFIFPGAGALSLIAFIGAFAILFGILLIVLALRLRSLPHPV